MPTSDPFNRLVNLAAAAVGAVGFVYIIGAASLSLRYDGLGLSGQVAAAMTPREVLLAAGLRTLLAWSLVGVLIAAVLNIRRRWLARAIIGLLRQWRSWVVLAVIVGALLLLSRVVWIPVAVISVLAVAYATVRWHAAPARRLGVTVLAIGVFAIAYEADRLEFYVESTCVYREGMTKVCGRLVGQQDRGIYLAVPDKDGPAAELHFIPATVVTRVRATKVTAEVDDAHRESRRKRIIERIPAIEIR